MVEKDEMRTADLGVAADGDVGVIFKKGEEITENFLEVAGDMKLHKVILTRYKNEKII